MSCVYCSFVLPIITLSHALSVCLSSLPYKSTAWFVCSQISLHCIKVEPKNILHSSVVTLAGNVNFINGTTVIHSSSGRSRAVYLKATHPEIKSSLIITIGATVYFVNQTCSYDGGAIFGDGATMHIGAKAMVVFMNNAADMNGGAVCGFNAMLHIGAN